ncbi:MAG: potassium-transporting ATPase subunit KdpA [Thermoplasmata archaeon]|nr:potassium-transporting ATPase subunit KdpA [Thermoplasmata archaeon]
MLEFASLVEIGVIVALGILLSIYFGHYMARVYTGRPTLLDPLLDPLERGIYRLLGTNPRRSMAWKEYAAALLVTNAVAIAFVFLLLYYQAHLPQNYFGVPNMTWDLALHTSSSFNTNTDYQHYAPELQASLFVSLYGLQLMMFLSAATGLSVGVAFIRGFTRRDGTIGNFWVDMVRSMTRVLLPVSIVGALVLLVLGVPQTFAQGISSPLLNGGRAVIPTGPVASWDAIEWLGTNGGGYFAANGGAPLQNPTPATNVVAILLMMLVPFSTIFMFGHMVRRPRESYPFLATVFIILFVALGLFLLFQSSQPLLNGLDVTQAQGNPVGSETRFSFGDNALFQIMSVYGNVGSTSTSLGSLAPGAQMTLLWGMFLQCAPGGEGTGFGMLLINSLLAIFLGGLMVGRTPEYLGKKLGRDQMRWAVVTLLSHPMAILIPLAIAAASGLSVVAAGPGSQSFTIVLYEFTSESANNGSGMAPINDNTPFFNVVGAIIMLVGRYLPIIAMLAIGGGLARQEPLPPSSGTLKTQSVTFTLYLVIFLIVVTGLLFLPVLALGPFSQGVSFP